MRTVLAVLGMVLWAVEHASGVAPAAARAKLNFEQVVLDNSYIAYERDVGDIDGDGHNDVVAVMEGDTTVQVFSAPAWRRSTLITFTGDYRYPRADDFKLADIDGDGDVDVVTRLGKGPSDDGAGIAVWCENIGGGSKFVQHLIGSSPEYVKDFVAKDFDRDGRPDIAMRMDSRTQIWLQEPGGKWTDVLLKHPAHEGMEVGDLDGDGDPDIVLNGYWFETPDSPAACRAAANYKFHVIDKAWFSQTGDWTKNSCKVVMADIDGDGKNDVVFSDSERAGFPVTWYRSTTPRVDTSWSKHPITVVDFCHNLQAADFNRDGKIDLLVGGMPKSQHRGLKLMLNDGMGTSWTELVIQTDGSYSAEIGDIDNDGDLDIVGIRNWSAAPTWIYRNGLDGNEDHAITLPDETSSFQAATRIRIDGPLRVHPSNPRYFTDNSGRAIYLTGSHTWANLQDIGLTNPPPAFDFQAYLGFLERHHHNFIRLWRWEFSRWTERNKKQPFYCAPQPWQRTGPGEALDGQPRFDLQKFDKGYFQRLRARTQAAAQHGIYVSIMLFEGWGLRFVPDGWKAHPFYPANNVNLTDSDVKGIKGINLFTLASPKVTALQEAYVRKVIDMVNDLDNVLYEIANESDFSTTDWQYHMIRFIKAYESTKPKQHPVGMTSIGYGVDDLDRLLKSPADWISPNPDHFDYKHNPPPADGAKVIILDTDHLWGVGGDVPWVWKSFLRGHNPIWMDPLDKSSVWEPTPANAKDVRNNLGYTLRFAERMNLAAMKPRPELASTEYCLANAGVEYLVYQPKPGEGFSVELKAGTYHYEWFDPTKGAITDAGRLESADGRQPFKAPFEGDAVLYLQRMEKPR
jgi:Family of unknown function (DUF6298)/FG-GAP-like repeat